MKGVREVLDLIFAITEIGDNGKKLCSKIPILFLLSSLHSGSWVHPYVRANPYLRTFYRTISQCQD